MIIAKDIYNGKALLYLPRLNVFQIWRLNPRGIYCPYQCDDATFEEVKSFCNKLKEEW